MCVVEGDVCDEADASGTVEITTADDLMAYNRRRDQGGTAFADRLAELCRRWGPDVSTCCVL